MNPIAKQIYEQAEKKAFNVYAENSGRDYDNILFLSDLKQILEQSPDVRELLERAIDMAFDTTLFADFEEKPKSNRQVAKEKILEALSSTVVEKPDGYVAWSDTIDFGRDVIGIVSFNKDAPHVWRSYCECNGLRIRPVKLMFLDKMKDSDKGKE